MQSDQSAISSRGVAQKLHYACRHGRDYFSEIVSFLLLQEILLSTTAHGRPPA